MYWFLIFWFMFGVIGAGFEVSALIYHRHPNQQRWETIDTRPHIQVIAFMSLLLVETLLGGMTLVVCIVHVIRGRYNLKLTGCLPHGIGCRDMHCDSCWETTHNRKPKSPKV
jgi:hypothetical protein